MLVYGDHKEIVNPAERLAAIGNQLPRVAGMPPGLGRHAKLVGALIDAGQIVQGLADSGNEVDDVASFTHQLALCVIRSLDSDYNDFGKLPGIPEIALPQRAELRLPEGFAFYAVYPETYVEAARKLSLSGEPRVVGIRSIGTTLGAIVAATLGAPVATTVRPTGDPFSRRVELPPTIVEPGAHYVIVDEGPGLSGSSFGAVADWLETHGAPPERIAFLPSHGGDLGPQASGPHRRRWHQAQRVAAEFKPTFLEERFGKLEPFSNGHPWERLKYRASSDGDPVLLKFVGLGLVGERKWEMAQVLHAAGFTPEPLALVHGFTVERWCEDALQLASDDKPIDQIGAYIGARAKLFPAAQGSGATIEELREMCRRNLSLAIGEERAGFLDRVDARALSSLVVRTRTDNKLDRAEWLRTTDGRLLKCDAVDHHCSHDLIGCQDIAWDVAGASVEFALDDDEGEQLADATARSASRPIDRELLNFYRLAYCCFRLGHARLAAETCTDMAERERMNSRAMHYETTIRPLLEMDYCCFTPQESLID